MHLEVDQTNHQFDEDDTYPHYHLIQLFIINTKSHRSIILLTNRTGVPQGETLGLIKPLSNNSSSWTFNYLSSIGTILYGVLEIGVVVGTKSIVNSTSLFGGKLDKSSRKTSG